MTPKDSVAFSEHPGSRVIFSIPHDGVTLEEFQLFPARIGGVQVHDERTMQIVSAVNEENPVAGVIRGLLPREVCDYNRPLTKAFDVPEVEEYYHRYHKTLESSLNSILKRHGQSILLDVHSFWGLRRPTYDLIFGSQGGITTPGALDQKALAYFTAEGFTVGIDKQGERYAGGYTVKTYGKENVSALQIEISSTLLYDKPARYEQLVKSLRSFVLSLQ